MAGSPINVLNENGDLVIEGSLVAPAASTGQVLTVQADKSIAAESGGSQPLATLNISDQDSFVAQSGAAVVVGGESFTGAVDSAVSYLVTAAPTGTVVSLGSIIYALAGTVASAEDDFDINVTVSVSDAAGLNAATATMLVQLPSPVTDLASVGTMTGQTWDVTAGTDLTFNEDLLKSTAGGTFFVTIFSSGGWD